MCKVFIQAYCACTLLLFTSTATAYSKDALFQAYKIYSPNIHGVLFEDIPKYLTTDELNTLSKVSLEQPWQQSKSPFGFYSVVQAYKIIVPTLAVKFFDDVAIAIAWYERFGCDKADIFDVVTAMDRKIIPLGSPTRALGIPDQAYKLDDYVNDVSQKTLKSAIAFILLHELAHLHFQHKGYSQITNTQAQQQEIQSDAFALNIMQRMNMPPYGIVFWFTLLSHQQIGTTDNNVSTHPLSSERLNALGSQLINHPQRFIAPNAQNTQNINSIIRVGKDINNISGILNDPKIRQLLRQRGQNIDLKSLKGQCEQK